MGTIVLRRIARDREINTNTNVSADTLLWLQGEETVGWLGRLKPSIYLLLQGNLTIYWKHEKIKLLLGSLINSLELFPIDVSSKTAIH